VREGVRYASGMASNEFSNFTNRLMAMAGLGQAATNTSAAAGMNHAGNVGNAAMYTGNARASAYGNMAAGVNNAVQGGIQNYMLQRYLGQQQSQTWTPPPPMANNYTGPTYGNYA
jgi:hypothetical protein